MTTEIKTCDKHGDYEATQLFGNLSDLIKRPVWSRCPKCSEEREAKDRKLAEQQEIQRFEQSVDIAEIPLRFRSCTLESYQADTDAQKKALSFAKDYADNFEAVCKTGRSALFIGKPGTGKTHLSIGIALQVLRNKQGSVLFTSTSRLLRRIKETYRKGNFESEREAFAAFTRCGLLIIDEVGVQFGTEYEKNTIFDVINERYENMRPTLLLSNLKISEIKDYLGERTYDRLREGGGQAIAFTWDSHRSHKQ